MPQCSYCNSTILFGGARDGELRFCNAQCQQEAALVTITATISPAEIDEATRAVHEGACPVCGRVGGVDLHTSHSIWSALVLTSWKSTPKISCPSCGKKAKAKATLSSLLLGWWGLPWGVVLTPVQIARNLWGLFTTEPSREPSPELARAIRLQLASMKQKALSSEKELCPKR